MLQLDKHIFEGHAIYDRELVQVIIKGKKYPVSGEGEILQFKLIINIIETLKSYYKVQDPSFLEKY